MQVKYYIIGFSYLSFILKWNENYQNKKNSLKFYILISGCCYLLNSAINPFLYSIFSKRFRRGFYALICWKNSPFFKRHPVGNSLNHKLTRSNRHVRGNRVVNRRAILRHLDLRLSGDKPIAALGKCNVLLIKEPKDSKVSKNRTSSDRIKNKMTNETPCTLYSEPILKRSASYGYTDTSERNGQISLFPAQNRNLSLSLPNNIESNYNLDHFVCLQSKDRTDKFIYKAVFATSHNKYQLT